MDWIIFGPLGVCYPYYVTYYGMGTKDEHLVPWKAMYHQSEEIHVKNKIVSSYRLAEIYILVK